ncbi:hypothetical protein WME73_10835 [Sorangium sp. So ce302]|uniref:hypothetical protein n=1 Tax=Sorangium sp. So ce302 TaxID=3133297 RepID=UPI003F5E3071
MKALEPLRFLFELANSYRVPAGIVAAINIALAIGAYSVLPKRAAGSTARVGAFVLAGLLGGPAAVAETLIAIELLDFQHEAAGLALAFLPVLLVPTTVAVLVWLFGDSLAGGSRRPALTLLGAILGATTLAPLLAVALEHPPPLLRELSRLLSEDVVPFVWYAFLALPVAAGAACGSTVLRRASR